MKSSLSRFHVVSNLYDLKGVVRIHLFVYSFIQFFHLFLFFCPYKESHIYTVGKKIIWSPADFVRLPTDKEMISL